MDARGTFYARLKYDVDLGMRRDQDRCGGEVWEGGVSLELYLIDS